MHELHKVTRSIAKAVLLTTGCLAYSGPLLADSCMETATVNADCTPRSPSARAATPGPKPAPSKSISPEMAKRRAEITEALNRMTARDDARRARERHIRELADSAIEQQNLGQTKVARTLYAAALRDAGDTPGLAERLQAYVEHGTRTPLSSWFGDDVAKAMEPAVEASAPAVRSQPGLFTMDAAETEAEIRRLHAELAAFNDPNRPATPEECNGMIANLASAAQHRNAADARGQYQALKEAGGCGVIDMAKEQGAGNAFPQRRMGDLTQSAFGGCMAQPEKCAAMRPSDNPGVEGLPNDDFLDRMIGILGAMQGALGAAQALQGGRVPAVSGGSGGTDMSTINRRARSTYGNGTPTPAPRTRPSDITGTGR